MDAPLFQGGTNPRQPRRIELLGQPMDLVTPQDVLAFVADAVARRSKAIIANHNLHSLYLVNRHPEMARFYEQADLVEVDSRPLLLWGKLLGLPTSGAHRCTYLDWRDDFWRLADERGWRVFYLGGAPGVAAKAAARLMQRWPGVEIAARHGYFDRTPGGPENQAVLDQINAFRPHVLLVGLGMPIQEAWIARHLNEIDAGALCSVGAAFDYEAGVQVAAPRLLGRLGLEWLFRLLHDPRRLFNRYLVEPWFLIGPALQDARSHILRGRRPPPSPKPMAKPSVAARA